MSTWQMECLMDSLGALTGATIGLLVIVFRLLRDFVKFKAIITLTHQARVMGDA